MVFKTRKESGHWHKTLKFYSIKDLQKIFGFFKTGKESGHRQAAISQLVFVILFFLKWDNDVCNIVHAHQHQKKTTSNQNLNDYIK
jgi:hypothetical protein